MPRKLALSEVPCFALAIRQSKFGHDILHQYLIHTLNDKHQHALAVATHILAFPGQKHPYEKDHAVFQQAISLLKNLYDFNQKLQKDHLFVKFRKTYHPDAKMSQDYDITPPADHVHHERTEWNKKHGISYIPPRSVGTRTARRGVKDTIVSIAQARVNFWFWYAQSPNHFKILLQPIESVTQNAPPTKRGVLLFGVQAVAHVTLSILRALEGPLDEFR